MVLLTSLGISKGYFFKPDMVHPALSHIDKTPLNVELFHNDEFIPLWHLVEKKIDLNIHSVLGESKHFIFFPHPKFIHETHRKEIMDYFSQTPNIKIKLHPRDTLNSKYFSQKNFSVIPKEFPAELLFLNLSSAKIFGFNTTVLLTAKWLNPDLEVYLLKFHDKNDSDQLENLMIKNDINILRL